MCARLHAAAAPVSIPWQTYWHCVQLAASQGLIAGRMMGVEQAGIYNTAVCFSAHTYSLHTAAAGTAVAALSACFVGVRSAHAMQCTHCANVVRALLAAACSRAYLHCIADLSPACRLQFASAGFRPGGILEQGCTQLLLCGAVQCMHVSAGVWTGAAEVRLQRPVFCFAA
jgi:hypothetical protein